MSCAGKSSSYDPSSYRSPPLRCKAAAREPSRTAAREAARALRLRLECCKRALGGEAAALEIRANVGVAVAAVGEPLGPKRRRSFVVEIAQPFERVERLPPLGLVDALSFEPCVQLGARAVGGPQGAKGDLLRPSLRQPLRAPSRHRPAWQWAAASRTPPGRRRPASGSQRASAG